MRYIGVISHLQTMYLLPGTSKYSLQFKFLFTNDRISPQTKKRSCVVKDSNQENPGSCTSWVTWWGSETSKWFVLFSPLNKGEGWSNLPIWLLFFSDGWQQKHQVENYLVIHELNIQASPTNDDPGSFPHGVPLQCHPPTRNSDLVKGLLTTMIPQ